MTGSAAGDVGAETEAYAAYLNAPRGVLDGDEQHLFDQDLAKARAAMERAWLQAMLSLKSGRGQS
jgi:hypothetical protein